MNTISLLRKTCLGLALLAGASLNAQTYTTQIISPPPGTSACVGDAVNGAGQVVGRTTVVVGSGRKSSTVRGPAFIWSGGASAVLPPLSGRSEAESFAISDAGLAVGGGTYFTVLEDDLATWWENTGSGYVAHDWNDLVPAAWGVTLLRASGISGDGQYVSFLADTSAAGQRDVVVKVQLDATGKIPLAVEQYWDVCEIWGITAVNHNAAGLLQVTFMFDQYPQTSGLWATLWTKDSAGSIQTINLHPSSESQTVPWGVNSYGEVVGDRRNSTIERAVVWEPTGSSYTMYDVGTLGGSESVAHSINDSGVAVGWALSKGKGGKDGPQRAFVWSGGSMVDLNTLTVSGPALTQGRQINNAGQILCWSGSTSVLLTPQ